MRSQLTTLNGQIYYTQAQKNDAANRKDKVYRFLNEAGRSFSVLRPLGYGGQVTRNGLFDKQIGLSSYSSERINPAVAGSTHSPTTLTCSAKQNTISVKENKTRDLTSDVRTGVTFSPFQTSRIFSIFP